VAPLFLSSMRHNYNAVLRVFAPPRMHDDFFLPLLPPNVCIETNGEASIRIGRDLTLIANQQFSATGLYRRFGFDEDGRPYWGYVVEWAFSEINDEPLMLMRLEERGGIEKTLHWVPRDSMYTFTQAELLYDEQYVGLSEEVMREIVEVFRDVFEFASASNWSYEKRMEFYHSFPFEEMLTREDVMSFRPVLFGCPAFAKFNFTFPECE